MPTTIQTLVTRARKPLLEPTASFWTDQELADVAQGAIRDLWRSINDNYQKYFNTVDITHVSQVASATTLTGVPADVSIVRGIEPRTLSSYRNLVYEHREYMHPLFQGARAQDTVDPGIGGVIYFDIAGAGGPVAAPTIYVAPKLSVTVLLTLIYVPVLADVALTGDNPIPGESDQALSDWIVAYALAKRHPDGQPDQNWLSLYATEKTNILTSLTPRQTQDDDVAEGLFEMGECW